VPIRVYFQDTDAGGVAFHGTYLDFLERARTEWLRALGFDQRKLMREDGVLFIVRALELAYLKPALLDDLLAVTASVEKLGRAQLTLKQEARRGTECLVRASVNLACVGVDGLRPAPIPERVYAALWDAAGPAARHPGVSALEQT
jgi:acyl-CoA thioester hydrolase